MSFSLSLRFRQPELNVFSPKPQFPFSNSLNHQLPISACPKMTLKRTATHWIVRAKINSPIEGVSEELNLIASRNLDFAYTRRQVRSAFNDVHRQLDHCLFKLAPSGIGTEEWYERNSMGLEIFCRSWMPKAGVRIKGRPELLKLPCFILGQSMGGAVTIKAHLKEPHAWDGVVLVAPMCKIAEEVIPPAAVLKVLTLLARVIPKAKLFPQKDLTELAFRDLRKRKMAIYNVICYSDQMRLKTAVELLKATSDIEKQVEKVSSSLLILHGAADKVTDPLVSKFLYEKASSTDKTLKLYDEGYHCILEGEPDDRILTVLGDIISWLDARC